MFRALNLNRFKKTAYWEKLNVEMRHSLEVLTRVLPFRVNHYVLSELINWDTVPDDPIFQLTFPQRGMIYADDFDRLSNLIQHDASDSDILRCAIRIRRYMNPNPAGQTDHNVPEIAGRPLPGLQHKYPETLLYFPGQARTCHSYCTYCFRWPLIVDKSEFDFDKPALDDLLNYLRLHHEITDLLITGGDPLVMATRTLAKHIEPLFSPEFDHVQNIRIGTKALANWPHRFVDDPDAEDLLRLFERIYAHGKQVAIMAHISHPVELSTAIAQEAMKKVCSTGANVRIQAPLARHINDDPDIWADIWGTAVNLGAIPYYMFVERDTGPKDYFEVPLVEALDIFQSAFKQVSGLARTVRGPSMSAYFGKICLVEVVSRGNQKFFALKYLQARNPNMVNQLFFAKFDATATWFDDLQPATSEDSHYFRFEGSAIDDECYMLRV